MTIPQADSTDLRSVSDRQEVVTLAEVSVLDQTQAEVSKTAASPAEDEHQTQQQQKDESASTSPSENPLVANAIESACVDAPVVIEHKQRQHIKELEEERAEGKGREEGKLEDAILEHGTEAISIGNQHALKSGYLALSLLDSHDNSCEERNNVIDREHDVATFDLVHNPEGCPKDEGAVSALPLLKIPSYSSITTPSVSYDHRTRKSSINFPISNRESSSTTAVSTSSSSSSSSLSNSRKNRRKSLPQRLGLRYQKIPQDDIAPPSVEKTANTNAGDSGILNPQYIPSPDAAPCSSSSRDQPSHQLSFHSAEVHASFHPSQTSTSITTTPNPSSHSIATTSQTTNTTFSRDVSFAPSNVVTNKTGSNSSTSKGEKKKGILSAVTTLSTSTSSSSKNRDKSGRGGRGNKSTLPLRRTLSLSLKSLNDLSVVHPTGRGNSNRKKYKSHSRSVSTEDLANCRVHRTGGGRFAGDPHPSPGSPSHCCLVSVSRVPMAAATSHLTLDSEYQTVRLAVLGAPGVGKSSIVKQFVMQQFLEEYVPTEQRQIFCPAVIINDHLYEVRIIDCPYIPYFPVNSLYEWTDFRGYGLRNATAYVLVYDITSEESFEYIKSLRLQILESRNLHDVPIFVVGNKHDLAEERGVPRREVANLVKKQWKCGYIECSAKYNWHIMLLFKELMKTVDYIDYGHKPTSLRVQDALRRNRCIIL